MNQIDAKRKVHKENVDKEVIAALEFELFEAVVHSGGVLTGFSIKIGDSDVLMTLRAVHSGQAKIAWVGCPDMSSCFRKAVTEGYHDGLKWKPDKFAER